MSAVIFAGRKLLFSLPDGGERSPAALGCERSLPRTPFELPLPSRARRGPHVGGAEIPSQGPPVPSPPFCPPGRITGRVLGKLFEPWSLLDSSGERVNDLFVNTVKAIACY